MRFIPLCRPCLPQSAHWRAPDPCAVLPPAHRHIRSLLTLSTSSLLHLPACAPLSCETFRREPATRQFVWSFAPIPISCHRVEHQNSSDPPPVFLLASITTDIVHCLSGPTATTSGSPPAPALVHSPRCCGSLLGPCYNTGPSPRLTLLYFHCFTLKKRLFHISLAVLLRYRSPAVFSLRCCYHLFALHYQTALLFPRRVSGAITRSGPAFHRIVHLQPQYPRAFHWGSFLFSRPY